MSTTTAPVGSDLAAWEAAQRLWGVRLHDARMAPGAGEEQGAPAWFTFPPVVTVDPVMVARLGGAAEMESVFAHELGHHVLAPSTRLDALKIRHQMARALQAAGAPALRDEDLALMSNLWTDLLVNARVAILQRRRDGAGEPGIVRLSRELYRASRSSPSPLWWVYLRTYELLWNLPGGTLCDPEPPEPDRRPPKQKQELPWTRIAAEHRAAEKALRQARKAAERVSDELAEATVTRPALDADVLASLVRTFAGDAVAGALRFGVVVAPYLIDPRSDGAGSLPGGTCAADTAAPTPSELGRVLSDRRLSGAVPSSAGAAAASAAKGSATGQALGIAQTLELYADADPAAVIAAWYRAEATRWVRPFTQRLPRAVSADLPGPFESWETGDDLADLDWPATLQAGGVVVPGVTTLRRSYLADDPPPVSSSIDLDLYIDSSGSMPQPQTGSPAVLAGTILALSVLRGGGRVRVTSFSGPGQVAGHEEYSRDPARTIADLAHFFAGGTTFPLDLLDKRYAGRGTPDAAHRRHLVVLSDDGLTSLFGDGDPARADVARRVRKTLSTATLVVLDRQHRVAEPALRAGYDVMYIERMDDAPAVCARLAEVLGG